MVKNHVYGFTANQEDSELIVNTLKKLNSESNFKVRVSDLLAVAVKKFCMELKCQKISSAQFFFNDNYKK
jgi:pyruvate-formate lyase